MCPAADVSKLRVPAAGCRDLPAGVVLMGVGRDEIGGDPDDAAAGTRVERVRLQPGQRIKEVGVDGAQQDIAGRVETHLAVRGGENLSIVEAVGPPEHSQPGSAEGKAEARREVVAIASVGDLRKAVHLTGPGGRFVPQPEAQREVAADAPGISGKDLHLPAPESAVRRPDRLGQHRRRAETQVAYRVTPEVGAEHQQAAMGGTLDPVQLLPCD